MFNPETMGGKSCIRGMRVTVETIVGLMASGYTFEFYLTQRRKVAKEERRKVCCLVLR